MINPKIFIGPMSKNIVDAIIEYSNKNNTPIGIIPSRRQIEHDGGYVNGWKTEDFAKYVKNGSDNILLVRDHGGPLQGATPDSGIDSFVIDCNFMDLIHVDVWKKHEDYHDGLKATIEFINLGYSINPDLCYEIGTEESIRPTTPEELNQLINDLRLALPEKVFKKIIYCVIQSGTALEGSSNTGNYNQDRLTRMVNVVKKQGLIPKEHNGDYLPKGLINEKFKSGLECINIAPEFGGIETKMILDSINDEKLVDEFYEICYDSKKWVKWVPSDYKPEENKIEIIKISGHYVFSDPKFIELKSKLSISDDEIKNEIKNRIKTLLDESKI